MSNDFSLDSDLFQLTKESPQTPLEGIIKTLKKEFLGAQWATYYILIGFLYLISIYFAIIGSYSQWYESLKKPDWAPSLFLGALLGGFAYISSFYGLYLAFDNIYKDLKNNMEVYEFFMITITISTGLLTIWSYLLFLSQAIGLATLFIFLGFAVYLVLIIEIGILYPLAGFLNIPYLLYLLYFTLFTAWLYIENPQARKSRF